MSPIRIRAEVEHISPLTDSITRLILKPDEYIPYEAGQYLQIHIGADFQSYSIANAPLGSHHYELHIRHSCSNQSNIQLFEQIREKGILFLSLPYGACKIEALDPEKPILFIAGGIGFAPVHAMIEQLLATHDQRPFKLFWGARSATDLYLHEKVLRWQAHVAHFQYYPFISEGSNTNLASLILKLHPNDLTEWQIVISGPFDMVYSTRDILVNHGLSPTNLFSDAFSFEAKP